MNVFVCVCVLLFLALPMHYASLCEHTEKLLSGNKPYCCKRKKKSIILRFMLLLLIIKTYNSQRIKKTCLQNDRVDFYLFCSR